MKFNADLHIHSKYSRATAKNLDLENLYHAAQVKGLQVVGTGDFTYPDWISEIETKLEPAEPGLFRLKKEFAEPIDTALSQTCRQPVRFILQTEISNIYKKEDRVRKNHNLVFFPDIKSVKQFNARLDAIGNIKSDGRPILGLDAAELLRLMLEVNDEGFFVPAHIWTPWFSMFGSKSGFDSIEECFGDLSKHIFAVETGLSSDPPMNWRVKDLDRVRLISNSDAHSPGYLGRNASVFDTDLSFFNIRNALETNDLKAFQGTLDMFPHQGKYHYDGHRKCNVCLNPASTAAIEGICPECGRKLTLGVLYRVQELADRPEGYQPENRHGYQNIIPLADILSEIFQVGPKTKKVTTYYNKAIETLGPELDILVEKSFDEIKSANIPLLAEAVEKMRTGDVNIDPGFDGEFGKVNLFTREEKERLQGERYPLFSLPAPKKKKKTASRFEKALAGVKKKIKKKPVQKKNTDLLQGLNPEQQKAVDSKARAMIIQAGPGTGKTRTLTAKIAFLVSNKRMDPASILALTFTNKAAKQLSQRIETFLPRTENKNRVMAATFHAFCLTLLKQHQGFDALIGDDDLRYAMIGQAAGNDTKKTQIRLLDNLIGQCKQQLLGPADDLAVFEDQIPGFALIYEKYESLCREHNIVDFEGLIFLTVTMLRSQSDILDQVQQQYSYVFIDEYQDLNFGQYELTRLLAQKGHIVVIGDPDQSIYGFRGSDNRYFKSFSLDFPGCEKIVLTQNYRSTQTILDASFQMISQSDQDNDTVKIFSNDHGLQKLIIKETASENAEAVAIGKMIESLVGGTSFFSMDAGKIDLDEDREYSFSDFAILYRTRKEAQAFITVFEREGIPFQAADKVAWVDTDGIRELISLSRLMAGKESLLDFQTVFELFGAGKKLKDILDSSFGTSKQEGRDILVFLADGDDGTIPGQMAKIARRLLVLKTELSGLDNSSALEKMCSAAGMDKIFEKDEKIRQDYERLLALAGVHPDLGAFLDEIALNRDVDTMAFKAEKVSLMTMHAAKGLEFPVVFVAGCEQGLIPFARDGKTISDLEEERRLFYVAMTRAMEILCLTYAKKRRIFGISKKRQQSLFIKDIEQQLTRVDKMPAFAPARKKEQQLELF